jgi:hypothetical protein
VAHRHTERGALTRRHIESYPARIDDVRATLDLFLANLAELDRRSRFAARDGYPSSSMGGEGSSGQGPSDPTGTTAAADIDKPVQDSTGQNIRDAFTSMDRIVREAERVEGCIRLVMNVEAEKKVRTNSIPECVNPWCGVPLLNVRAKRGRCPACYEYQRVNDRDAGPHVINLRNGRPLDLSLGQNGNP